MEVAEATNQTQTDALAKPAKSLSGARYVFVPFKKAFVAKYNPRRPSEVGDVTQLAESIKAIGCTQPPCVRLVTVDGEERYEVVYGQRRFLAAIQAFGEEAGMEMVLKELTDEQAFMQALSENIERLEMSPVDEAEAAAKALAMFGGDRKEASTRLGWSISMLNGRLKLMSCSDVVRERLATDKAFPMSIAELLAGLKRADQDLMLAEYDKLGTPSAESFKTMLMTRSKSIQAAIFETDECAGCANNSSIQRAMFDTGLDDGHCMNSACYDAKTEGRLLERQAELKETFQRVMIIRPGEATLVRKLMKSDGIPTVGDAQFQACRGCADFGALVSGTPESLGRAGSNICFDPTCNSEKVAAHQQALKDAAQAEQDEQQAQTAQGEAGGSQKANTKGRSDAGPKGKPDPKGKSKPGKTSPAPVVSVTLTNSVKEYRDALYRTVIAKEVAAESHRGLALLTALACSSRLSAVSSTNAGKLLSGVVGEGVSRGGSSLSANFRTAMSVDRQQVAGVVKTLSLLAIDSLNPDELVSLVAELNPDWNVHFKLGADFFKTLTKNEMMVVAQAVGLDAAIGDSFKGLMSQKVGDLIEKLTTVEGFNYNGAIPAVLKPGFGKN